MFTSTKVAISALLLACSATGALAQSQIGNGPSAGFTQRAKANYVVRHHKSARQSQVSAPVYSNEVPFAPF